MLFVGIPLGAMSGRSNLVRDYAALLTRIDDFFIGEFDEEHVTTAAMRAAIDALDDPWSFFMTAEEYERNQDHTLNRYPGIGVTVVFDDEAGYIRVVEVFRGSAAETAGILPGDLILAVDGEDSAGISLPELRGKLRRPIGQSAQIKIERSGGETETVEVVFSHITIIPLSYEMLDDGIGYIRLYNFNAGSADGFIGAVRSLMSQGAVGLIFDMRGNGGGWVTEMTQMLDFLLPEGDIFVAVDASGRETVTTSGPDYLDMPMVVLVDRFSFSGAEYFAAIMSEFGFAQTVGEQTTGKSRMQRVVRLPGGGAINISIAEYLTKNRVSLHDAGGFTPDYTVLLTDEELALFLTDSLEYDPQLQKAIYLLATSK